MPRQVRSDVRFACAALGSDPVPHARRQHRQASRARSAQQAQEHGFRAIIGVVRGCDPVGSDAGRGGAERFPACIARAGLQGRGEGVFFGWWNFATKLNFALAAGVALPLLALAGYSPGARTPQALVALTFAYCLLPCGLKLAAAALLYFNLIRNESPP